MTPRSEPVRLPGLPAVRGRAVTPGAEHRTRKNLELALSGATAWVRWEQLSEALRRMEGRILCARKALSTRPRLAAGV